MQVECHKWWSPAIGHDMELKVYGHQGKPVVAFPSHKGRFHDFEGFGMIESIGSFIDDGRVTVFAVDGIDGESWANESIPPAERARRHQDYDRYIVDEVAPFIRGKCGGKDQKFLGTGCSMGGYHSANFFFRHPDVFDALVAISGVYRLASFVENHMDENVYANSPLDYLPNLNDRWYLDQYRRSQIVVAVGQGAWENETLQDTRELETVLAARNVPAWIDFWGYDVNHDWPWWRKMLPYFLGKMQLV